MNADGWVMVIGAIAAGLVLVITAAGTVLSALVNRRKLNEIHTLTNSGLATVKDDLIAANRLIHELQGEIKKLKAEKNK